MENLKDLGIVLNSIDYKESSKIVYLYTKEGIKSIKVLGAKNQKKGYLPFLMPVSYVEFIYTNSKFPTLIDYSIINSYKEIKSDLKKELLISYMFEILSKIPEDASNERIFPLVLKLLDLTSIYDPRLIVTIFKVKMLYTFGVAPSFKTCAECGSSDVYYFNVLKGGAVCKNCSNLKSYNNDILNIIKNMYYIDIYNKPLDIFKDINIKEIFDIVEEYYKVHVNIYTKGINSILL